ADSVKENVITAVSEYDEMLKLIKEKAKERYSDHVQDGTKELLDRSHDLFRHGGTSVHHTDFYSTGSQKVILSNSFRNSVKKKYMK
ncbi:hypothetical protein, partial [Salmonella enterica]|uniref:hypothetical protein n=1 Tax=Salmonella enterica TaxID=28901 RepID=UPI0014824291